MTTNFTPAGMVARYAVIVEFNDNTKPLRFREATFTDVKARVASNKAMLLRMAEKTEGARHEVSDCKPEGLFAAGVKRLAKRYGAVPVWKLAALLTTGQVVTATISIEVI